MHPQLSDRKSVCQEFIEALERCHATGWNRMTGACNTKKDALNGCLRSERIARSTSNREMAKEKRQKTDQALKEFRALES
ncbi:UPF0287-domain-containing protein [Coprinopsis marcescibilis]|uniref:COX assembly mitochondrial protein n=1 Tax=Coprinopsis marcescibilis TaxID=230819 RepID=A0A5C3L1M8_COPMA|nr:UPF0287-domain-containing protein [Coprinopsis marcescibilis]